MIDGELLRFVRQEISRQLNIILPGVAGGATVFKEDIDQLYPGMPTITERPIMHPFGVSSIAPRGTISITGQMGDHIGNRMVLGHMDKDAPEDIDAGETAVYSLGEYQVRVLNGKIELGKGGVFEEMVMGETLRQFLLLLLQYIMVHTHMSNVPSAPTSAPQNNQDFLTLKQNNLDNSKILSKDGGRF